jgi:hypothetical protein
VAIWQVLAGLIVVALVAAAARLLRRSRRPSQLVLVFLLAPVPVAGFALYALVPGPLPSLTLATWIGSFLLAVTVYPVFCGRRASKLRRASTVTFRDISSVNRHILAWRTCALLAVTAYLFMFEPWFAAANLVAVAAWVAIWIPARRRRKWFEMSGQIRATPEATFAYVVEPSNWSRYRADVQAVTTHPDGPLALGTVVTMRRTIPTTAQGKAAWPGSIQERLTITAMARTSFTATMSDRQAQVSTDVQSIGSATTITGRSEWITPYTDALLGLGLEERGTIEAARQSMRRSYERLDELIGSAVR